MGIETVEEVFVGTTPVVVRDLQCTDGFFLEEHRSLPYREHGSRYSLMVSSHGNRIKVANKKNVKLNANKNKLAAKSTGWSIGNCEKACHYLLHLLFFLLPLTIFPFTYDNFDLPKLVLLRTLVFVAFGLWVAGQVFSRKVVIRRTSLDIFLLLFVAATLIAAIAGIDRFTGLWGKYGRYEGFFTFLTYGTFFFLTVQTFADPRRTKSLIRTAILAATLVSVYGLIQYVGLDFINWGEQAFEAERISSTFGNPILLAGYLVMMLPLMVARFQEEEHNYSTVLYATSILLAFGALLATFSRGGWLAFLVALAVIVLTQGKKTANRRMLVLTVCLMLVLVLAGAISFRDSGEANGPSLLGRLKSITSTGEGSVASRLLIWDAALKIIKDRPLLGYGPDTFHLTYPQKGSLKYAQLVGRWNQPDNAHNYLLQMASTTGLLGLWALVSLLVFLIWKGAKSVLRKNRGNTLLPAALFAGILAYLVHLQFSINVIDSGSTFFLLLGLFFAPFSREVAVRRGGFLSLVFLIFLASLFVAAGSFRFLLADINFLKAEQAASTGLFDTAAERYQKASRLNPYVNLYLVSLGRLYAEVGLSERDQTLIMEAQKTYLEGQRKNPLELDNYLFLADLYLRVASWDGRYYEMAGRELAKALKIYPFWADTHFLLGRLHFDTGRLLKAEDHYRRVVSIDPKDSQAYLYLARIYRKSGRLGAAYEAYSQVLTVDSENLEAKKGLEEIAKVAGAVTPSP